MAEKVSSHQPEVTVYYDGACPSCRRDRAWYEFLAGRRGRRDVCWFDITDQDQTLQRQGIDPAKALRELHVRVEGEGVVSELDAYIVLMKRILVLKPLAFLISLPFIRLWLAGAYHRMVESRLRRTGRGFRSGNGQ